MTIEEKKALISPYFTPQDFDSRDEPGTGLEKMNPKVLQLLRTIRETTGAPMWIASAYRTPKHNRAIGGAPNSAHVHGHAIDFSFYGSDPMPSRLRWRVLEILILTKTSRFGLYNSFIHIDTAPEAWPQNVVWLGGK